ncbi:MAG: HAD family hydrolase [Pseudobutyrivibrio sp.]|nr:HAD family hydrolase [Pseudobutyrivibrio sp.]
MNYEIVFCDVDGTLLNNEHRMEDSTVLAIKQLKAKEIPCVIVTARGPSGIYPIFKRYSFTCPMVCYSGALIMDEEGNVLQSNGFSRKTAATVIHYIEAEQFDCTWNIFSMNTWIVNDKEDSRVKREESIVEAQATEGDISDLPAGATVGKILCMCNPKQTAAIESALKAKFPCLSIVRSSDILIEIMNKGISKGESIRFLCDKWEIGLDKTVGVGDHYNDLDMLETVAMPFIMENAPAELKARIENVTLSNQSDGIYYGLKKIGLVD